MKTTALALMMCLGGAHAAVLASWDIWGDSSVGTYNADSELSGFQGVISNTDTGNRANSGGFGSTDGTFGSAFGGAATDNTALLVRKGNSGSNDSGWNDITLTITNNTGASYNIESIHFDLGIRTSSGNEFTLTYTSGGLGPGGASIGSASGLAFTGDLADSHDFNFDLTSQLSDFTLDDGESAVFTFIVEGYASNSASSTLDNVAFQGTLIPEPSTALLISLAGLAALRRRRG